MKHVWLVGLLLSGCGVEKKDVGCAAGTAKDSCQGNVLSFCGGGGKSSLATARTRDCAAEGLVCVVDGFSGGCVKDATPCTPETFQESCLDDRTMVICNISLGQKHYAAPAECDPDQRCVMKGLKHDCVPK